MIEIARLLVERNPGVELDAELKRLEGLTAGLRLRELRALDLAPDLDARIGEAIDRRNDLVHHLMEDPELAQAVEGDGIQAVADRIEQLALDCAALGAELHFVAAPKLEAATGMTQDEMAKLVRTIDLATLSEPRERKHLEALRALPEEALAIRLSDLFDIGAIPPSDNCSQR